MEIFRLKRIILYFYILSVIFSCQNKNDNRVLYYRQKGNNTLIDNSKFLVWNFENNTILTNKKIIKFNYNVKGNILVSENNKNILYYDFFTNKTYNFENKKNKYFFIPNSIKLKDSISIEYHNKNYFVYKFHCDENIRDGQSYHYFLKGWGIILYQIYGNEKYSNWMPFAAKDSYLKVDEIVGIIESLKNKNFLLGQMMLSPPKVPEIKE